MKKWILILGLSVFFANISAQTGRTVTVNVPDAGEPIVAFADVSILWGADVIMAQRQEKEDGSTVFSLPDDGTTFFVWVKFNGNDGQFQYLPYISLPGERVAITGKMYENYFDYDIKGSPMFEALAAHRKANNFLYEKELGELGYDARELEQPDEIKELLGKRAKLTRDYILANPGGVLSAYYLTEGDSMELENMELYNTLSDSVKNGPYKVFVDYFHDLYSGKIEMTVGD